MDFDALTPSLFRARQSLKWSHFAPEVLGAWVAEMDFGTAPCVRAAIEAVVSNEIFGYPMPDEATGLAASCANFQQRRFSWSVDPARVHALPDALIGLTLAIEHYSRPGSKIVLSTPSYPNFFSVAATTGREVVEVPMLCHDGRLELDLERIDDALANGAGTFILCNPNNPVGRSHELDELVLLSEVIERHDARVVADELHAPLTYGPRRHVPYASVSDAAAAHTVTVLGAAKGWNISGLKCAQVVLSNDEDEKVWSGIEHIRVPGPNTVAIAANVAAWNEGEPWLEEVLSYLDRNRTHLKDLVDDLLEGVAYTMPEGTYLAWLDCRPLELDVPPGEFFLEKAKVALVDGAAFGEAGIGHVRLNFATPLPILTRIVEQMNEALSRR